VPRDPDEAYSGPLLEYERDKRYRFKLKEVVEMESSYQDDRKTNGSYLSWHWTVHDMATGVPLFLAGGDDPYEFYTSSNDSTFYKKDATGVVSMGGARQMAQDLLGRMPTSEEIRQWNEPGGVIGWNRALVGKTLTAFIDKGKNKRTGADKLIMVMIQPDVAAEAPAGTPQVSAPSSNGKTAEEVAAERAELQRRLRELG